MLTLEQTMMEHSGTGQEFMEKLVKEWAEQHPNFPTDKQMGLGDYDPYQPNCCKNCPNKNNTFCNCAQPAMEQVRY